MKLFFVLIFLILFQNCSFDNKSGIWNSEEAIVKKNDIFKDFETLNTVNQFFDKEIQIDKSFNFSLSNPVKNNNWKEVYYNKANNFENFSFKNEGKLYFKGKKLSRYSINKQVLYENENLILTDKLGNILIFSIKENRILNKFNFYRKKFKSIKKFLNLIVENQIIYVADNLGFLYAYDYIENKIIWAKNYKTPFRSNLKISENRLILSDHNNNLFFINKKNGDKLKTIPSEEITVNNEFINNLSMNKKDVFFLNTFGSLYSIDLKEMTVNWFVNLNQSLDLSPGNLFFGSILVNYKNIILVSSNNSTYIINATNGSIIYKFNFSSKIKPVIINDYIFLITSNNLLISIDLTQGKLIYSHDLDNKVSEFLKVNKKMENYKNLFIANNFIYIILKKSYLLKFTLEGSLEKVQKLPIKIFSNPIFIDNSMISVNNKGRIFIFN